MGLVQGSGKCAAQGLSADTARGSCGGKPGRSCFLHAELKFQHLGSSVIGLPCKGRSDRNLPGCGKSAAGFWYAGHVPSSTPRTFSHFATSLFQSPGRVNHHVSFRRAAAASQRLATKTRHRRQPTSPLGHCAVSKDGGLLSRPSRVALPTRERAIHVPLQLVCRRFLEPRPKLGKVPQGSVGCRPSRARAHKSKSVSTSRKLRSRNRPARNEDC